VVPRPRPADQLAAFADEAVLGWPKSSHPDVAERVRRLPFAPALIFTARMAAAHWHVRHDADGQLRLFRECFGDVPFTRALVRFVAEGPHHLPVGEQLLFLLERLLVEHADARDTGGLTFDEAEDWVGALMGAGTLVGQSAAHLLKEATLEEWLAFLVQNGLYHSFDLPDHSLGRAYALFYEIARRDEARRHPEWRDLDEWLRAESGFDMLEQFAVGFAAFAGSRALDDNAPFASRAVIRRGYFAASAAFREREDAIWQMLAGDRARFQADFAELGAEPRTLAWFNTPFLGRPFVVLPDGGLVLSSPRSIATWCSDGFYYRLLNHASAAGGGREVNALTSFVGYLLETYAYELLAWAYGPRPPGGGVVWPEQLYGQKERTPDVVIDHGFDLVLIEVVASRVRRPTRVAGDLAALGEDLYRTVLKKIGELDNCINAILGICGRPSRAVIPGVDPALVRRVWPVLVTMEGLAQHEPLWSYIGEHGGTHLRQARVQPLTLLDIADLEVLAGAVRRGQSLIAMLERKTSEFWRRRDLPSWLRGDPGAPRPRGCGFTLERFERATAAAMNMLDLPPGA
jgi:hypothetical protein